MYSGELKRMKLTPRPQQMPIPSIQQGLTPQNFFPCTSYGKFPELVLISKIFVQLSVFTIPPFWFLSVIQIRKVAFLQVATP